MAASPVPHVVVLNGSFAQAEIYRGHLAFEGYHITTLTDHVVPADVLRLAPDLIVLSLLSDDGQRGLAFLRGLRREPTGGNVPVLISTPGALIDTARYGADLDALGATIIDGFAITHRLADAARLALTQPPAVRREAGAA